MAGATQGKKGSNKLKRVGSRKTKIEQYYLTRYPKNKIRRILDTHGISAAQSWADKHGCPAYLAEILNRRDI
jgi:hypothetical protein